MPEEISVFYIRMPWKNKGKITAIIQKQLAQVSGNGTSTLKQLIMSNARLDDIKSTLLKTYKHQLHNVPKEDEKFILSHIANIPNGAVFTNITHLCNDKLLQFFDEISLTTKFYYGRYDIKCNSVEDFFSMLLKSSFACAYIVAGKSDAGNCLYISVFVSPSKPPN